MKLVSKFSFVLLLSLFTTALFAQMGVGVRAGVTFPDQKYEESGTDVSGDAFMGLTFAGIFEIGLSDIFAIQPEIAYVQKGTKQSFEFLGEKFEYKLRINHIDVPILAKARFGTESLGAYVAVGPTFGYAISGFTEEDGMKEDIEDWEGYNRFEIGASLGAGAGMKLSSGMIFLDFRYLLGLTNLADDDDVTVNNQGINLSIGYLANLGQ